MLFRLGHHYRGLLLIIGSAVCALWLAATSQLNLYIHPRYISFTVIFSALIVAYVTHGARYATQAADQAHDQQAKRHRRHRIRRLGRQLSAAICVIGLVALLVSRPAALTSSMATQRGINSAAITNGSGPRQPAISPLFSNVDDYRNLSVKDWAGLLAETDEPQLLAGKKLAVSGFVTADQYDRNVFYVSRFVVSCCAVDARPVGLAVYQPNWRERFQADQWIKVEGQLADNPSPINREPLAVQADNITPIERPEHSYDY